jgi:NAD(P)-dependent dehydrogenase (short-subunit alcohol dehydrogenase family)
MTPFGYRAAMEAKGKAVVTGASRGIGRAVAIELARRGFDVIATMRNPADGAGLAGEATAGRLEVAELDVTRPGSINLPEGLRVLVNNAAIEMAYLPVEHAPLDMWRNMFETNVFGLLAVTQVALPLLRDAGGGVVCNVTSSSILAPMPFYAAYRASKAAVSAIGESLRAEVAAFGIRVVEIMPGPIDTDMLALSERVPEAIAYPPYQSLAERVAELRKPGALPATPTADAARAIVDAIVDDGGPLRYGCDPLSDGMLAGWRQATDEQFMQSMLAAFTG